MHDLSNAAQDVLAEHKRQKSEEGWTEADDDMHTRGEMAGAAACYAMQAALDGIGTPWLAHMVRTTIRNLWPWSGHFWRPKTPRRDLVRAAALIIAEIERLDRKEARSDA